MEYQKKLIIFRLFDSDPAMMGYLFESVESLSLRDHPSTIISDSWDLNQEQRILLRAALDIWSGEGNTLLGELYCLSENSLSRLLLAIINWCDLRSMTEQLCPNQGNQAYE